MNKDKIGAILKRRIKECGFTQAEFAEEVGIGLPSLKKYISGKVWYTIEILELFSSKLRCTYDYLLGKTDTPEPEYKTIKDLMHLSDCTIERIMDAANSFERGEKLNIQVYDFIIQRDALVDYIKSYLLLDEHEEYISTGVGMFYKSIMVGDKMLTVPDLKNAYLSGVISELIRNKENFGEDNPRVLYNYKYKTADDQAKLMQRVSDEKNAT